MEIATERNDETNFREMKSMDANRYATKKTIAQGMLDIALLTANASQLKYILQVGEKHEFYTLMLTLIILSIIMQASSGILSLSLSLLRDCRLHLPEYHNSANIINNLRTIFAFMITVLNMFISMLVGMLFVIVGSLNINRRKDQAAAIILNDVILVIVFTISLINVVTGVMLVILSMVSIHKEIKERKIAENINQVILALLLVCLFCDVIKMGFGFTPAISK